MKNAEDWMSEVHEKPFLLDSENKAFIKRIQADTLREAAKIAQSCIDENFHPHYHAAAQMVSNAILAKAKELE